MLQNKEIPVLDEERRVEEIASSVADDAPAGPDAKTLTSQVTDLIEDVRLLARAEVEYYRTKLSINLAATRRVLWLFGFAVVAGVMAIISLILGSLITLSNYVGPLSATGIVTGITMLVASVTMGMAIKRARKLPLDENDS